MHGLMNEYLPMLLAGLRYLIHCFRQLVEDNKNGTGLTYRQKGGGRRHRRLDRPGVEAAGTPHLPDGLQEIGEDACKNCASLTVVQGMDSGVHIGNNAFAGCSGLYAACAAALERCL